MTTEFDLWRLLAGIALFLFAMTQMESALKVLGGRSLALYLKRQAGKRMNAVIGGMVTTAFLQSSSVVGLMVLAFTGAGLLTLPSALGMVFGSNLGTTFTGWIVTTLGFKFEIFALASPLIAIGGATFLFAKGRWSATGRAFLSLGLLLLGLHYMKDSVAGLEQLIDLRDLAGLAPWQYLLFGLVVAAVIQSSSATMMLTLTALNADIITLPNAAAVAIGADLGTTTTVLLGALKGSVEKKRVAAGHFIFNVVTDMLAFALRLPLLTLVAMIGIEDPLYSLVAFHSLFNCVGLLIFVPLTGPFARLLEYVVAADDSREARYLGEVSPAISEAALAAVDRETSLLIARAVQLTAVAFDPPLSEPAGHLPVPHQRGLRELSECKFDDLYRTNKTLGGEILEFAIRLQAEASSEADSARLEQLLSATRRTMRSAKAIKDIRHNLLDLAGPVSDIEHGYLGYFRESMQACLAELYELREEDAEAVRFDSLESALVSARERHAVIHRQIFSDVRDDRVQETLVSTLLNVNRELMNCQVWIVIALGTYYLTDAQAEDLEQLPA